MNYPIRRRTVIGLSTLAALGQLPARAQSYPDKPVKFIVPYPAGGGGDYIARQIGAVLANHLGQPVLVENRPGGSSIIAAQALIRSPADGYTIMLGAADSLVFNVGIFENLAYDPMKDFTYVAVVNKTDMTFCVREQSPYKTMRDLVSAMQAKPGGLNYVAPGKASPHYIATELFLQNQKLKATAIQYQGLAPALPDFLTGATDFAMLDLPVALPQIKAGKIRVLAAATETRLGAIPDVPTMAEAGYPFIANAFAGIVMPAGVPRPVFDRFRTALQATMADEGLRGKFLNLGIQPLFSTGDEFQKLVASEGQRYVPLIRALGIKA